jgi:CheY-like chemotaxis protein
VLLDESRLTQVISNLLNNALKFTDAGGRVVVRVGWSIDRPDSVEVSVSDTGCGIPAEQLGRVFDRLYQVRSGDATTEQGIGLGLYICRELVRLHGGNISVDSELGAGTTFTFTLPKAAAAPASRSPRANLLVVDDDPAMREILSQVLEQAQFNVAMAEDGRAALQQIQRQVPDAVVMDLEMPGMDGPTTLREIRKHWGALPVILHTGRTDGPLLSQALEWSPFTVLAKPCPMEQLIQAVRGLERQLARPAGPPPAAVGANVRRTERNTLA